MRRSYISPCRSQAEVENIRIDVGAIGPGNCSPFNTHFTEFFRIAANLLKDRALQIRDHAQ